MDLVSLENEHTIIPANYRIHGFQPSGPDDKGNLVIDLKSLGVEQTPDVSRKGHVSFLSEYSFTEQTRPQPLIPKSLWDSMRLRWHASRQSAFVFYDKVVTTWTPHVAHESVIGQIGIVDCRYETSGSDQEQIEELLSRALWISGLVDLGREIRISGQVPFCIPVSSKQEKGVDLEKDNPIRVVVRVIASDMKLGTRIGSLSTHLSLALSTSPMSARFCTPRGAEEIRSLLSKAGDLGTRTGTRNKTLSRLVTQGGSRSARHPELNCVAGTQPARASVDSHMGFCPVTLSGDADPGQVSAYRRVV